MRRVLRRAVLLAGVGLAVAVPSASAWETAQYLVIFHGDQRSKWSNRQDITFSPCGVGFQSSGSEDVMISYAPVVVTAFPGTFLPSGNFGVPTLVTRQSTSTSWSDGLECASGGCDDCPPPPPEQPPDCGTRPYSLEAALLPFGSGMFFRLDFGQRSDPFRRCPAATSTRRWLGGTLREVLLQGFPPWLITGPGPPIPAGLLTGRDFDIQATNGGTQTTDTSLYADIRLLSFVPTPPALADAQALVAPEDDIPPAVDGLSVRAGAIRYRLSEPATTVFAVEGVRGRLRGTFRHEGRQGANRVRVPRRLRGRPLAPGSYRLVAFTADAAGNVAGPSRARFRVVSAGAGRRAARG